MRGGGCANKMVEMPIGVNTGGRAEYQTTSLLLNFSDLAGNGTFRVT